MGSEQQPEGSDRAVWPGLCAADEAPPPATRAGGVCGGKRTRLLTTTPEGGPERISAVAVPPARESSRQPLTPPRQRRASPAMQKKLMGASRVPAGKMSSDRVSRLSRAPATGFAHLVGAQIVKPHHRPRRPAIPPCLARLFRLLHRLVRKSPNIVPGWVHPLFHCCGFPLPRVFVAR
ncbi:hypothetical protein ANO11243_032460 [Dothideomycetidae sp. 11243]|nr:hypothetical protein ANO11243_032460 [fungal sp. No.11243]